MTKIHYRKRFLKGLFIALRILISYKLAPVIGIFLSHEMKTARLKSLHRKKRRANKEKVTGDERRDDQSRPVPQFSKRLPP